MTNYSLRSGFSHCLLAGVFALALANILTGTAYAESTGFAEPISAVFDWINEIFTATIDDSDLDPETNENLQDTLDSGTDAGKKGVSLWFAIHEFFVDAIFAGTNEADLPIDKDMIVIISMIMVFLLMLGLIMKLFRENLKIAIIVVIILLALGLSGVFIEF